MNNLHETLFWYFIAQLEQKINIMIKLFKPIITITLVTVLSCIENDPNVETNEVVSERHISELISIEAYDGPKQKVYVPVYSDIYNGSKLEKVLLTATLSIRNTSETDTLFLSRVAYFDTGGALVRQYIDDPIFIKPLESIDYVIEQKDDLGGNGANFMIDWYATKPIKPVFQCVMIGGLASRTFSFMTEGVAVE